MFGRKKKEVQPMKPEVERFENDLDSLHQWSVRNFMNFDVKKCKIMKIAKKIQPLTSSFFLENS